MIRKRNLDDTLINWIENELGGSGYLSQARLMAARPSTFDTQSKIFYVDKGGSDAFDGESPDKPLLTIAAAITKMNARINWSNSPWARGDTLVIFPGVYAENLTSLPYGCAMIGLGDHYDANGERGVKIKPASGAPFTGTSVINMRMQNIWWESADSTQVFNVANFNRNVFIDVHFQGLPGASPTTVKGFNCSNDHTGSKMLGCTIYQCVQGFYIDVAAPKQIVGSYWEDCHVGGCTTSAFYSVTGNTPAFSVLKRCVLGDNSATCTNPFYDGDSALQAVECHFIGTTITPATGSGKYSGCYHNGTLVA